MAKYWCRTASLQNRRESEILQPIPILYEAFVDPSIGAQDYIIPADGDYKNLDISNLKKVSASEFHMRYILLGERKDNKEGI